MWLLFHVKIFKIKLVVRTGVTEVNNTKSRVKFLHVSFSLVFIGFFDFLEQNVAIFSHIGSFEALLTFFGRAYLNRIKSML